MKRKILFVDDEPMVLQGLKRMLRSMRNEWDMAFAESGEEAMGILEGHPFEVLVTDMRMPGMNGAELLKKVQKRFPDMIRIVLSGHSDQELILKSVRTAHQYLSKPCNADTLKNTVSRACALRELLKDETLKQVVSNIDTLPSLPKLYQEIMAELQSEDAFMDRVGEIIKRSEESGVPLREVEHEVLGTGHGAVGAYLMGLWGFADNVVEAIAFHHKPETCPARRMGALAAVHVANALEHAFGPEGMKTDEAQVDREFLDQIGVAQKLERWARVCETAIQ